MSAPQLEFEVFKLLKSQGSWLMTLESCTGGLVSDRLTNISGASEIFWGGQIVYENSAKKSLAEVPDLILKNFGAVSPEVAQALVNSGLKTLQDHSPSARLNYALATTGIAGPQGGSPEKPVGLCYIAAANSQGITKARKINAPLHLDRVSMKTYFADEAFKLLLEVAKEAKFHA